MRNAETLIPFLVAVIALLGYIAWGIQRLSRSIAWFRRLPQEHEWLMKEVRRNGKEIARLSRSIEDLIGKIPS